MSMIKFMLPLVVSKGQYQIIESSIAMEEHTAITVSAMTGPQWHSLLTSERFSNTIIADIKFMVSVNVFQFLNTPKV